MSEVSLSETRATARSWPSLPVILLLAAAYTLLVIQYSFQHGRLSFDIVYDDVSYFNDSLTRFDIFEQKGLFDFLEYYRKVPPHAPVATLLAVSGFLFFGVRDWAPYAMNGVLVAVSLWFVARLSVGRPRHFHVAVFTLLFTCPFTFNAVHEFRPDFAAALFTAMGCVELLRTVSRPEPRGSGKIWAGVLFGVGLLAKPTVFPFTCVMLGSSLIAAALVEMDYRWRNFSLPGVLRSSALVLVPCLLLTLPHYLVGYKQTYDYIRLNVVGEDAKLWRYQGSWLDQFLYLLTDPAGRIMLGPHLWLLIGLSIPASVAVYLQGNRERRCFLLLLTALVAIAYVFPSLNKTKNPFFGLTFQLLLFFLTVVVLSLALAGRSSQRYSLPMSVSVSLLLMSSLFFFPPTNSVWWNPRASSQATSTKKINAEIIQALRSDAEADDSPSVVFLTTGGYVINAGTLAWLALKENIPFLFTDLVRSDDLEKLKKAMISSDYVLANEKGAAGQNLWLPSAKVADTTLAFIQGRDDFKFITQFETANQKDYFLFRNRRPSRKHSFFGWERAQNLLPYGHTKKLKWAAGTKLTLTFNKEVNYPMFLALSLSTQLQGPQEVRIVLNRKELARKAVPAYPTTADVQLALPAQERKNELDLEFAKSGNTAGKENYAATVHTLQITYDFAPLDNPGQQSLLKKSAQ